MSLKIDLDAVGFNPEKIREERKKQGVLFVLTGPFKVDIQKGMLSGVVSHAPHDLHHLEGKTVRVQISSPNRIPLETSYQGDRIDERMEKVIAERNIDAIVTEDARFYPDSMKILAGFLHLTSMNRIHVGPISFSGSHTHRTDVHGVLVWDEYLIDTRDIERLASVKALLDDSSSNYWNSLEQYRKEQRKTPYKPTAGFSIFVCDSATNRVIYFVPAQANHLSRVYNPIAMDIEEEQKRIDWRFSPPTSEDLDAFIEKLQAKFPECTLYVASFRQFRASKKSRQVTTLASNLIEKTVPIGFDDEGNLLFTSRDPGLALKHGVVFTGVGQNQGWVDLVKTDSDAVTLPEAFGFELDERLRSVSQS